MVVTFSTLKLVELSVSKVYELKLLSSLARAVADGVVTFSVCDILGGGLISLSA